MPIRLHITTEGQTEERFVKEVLAAYLGGKGVWADARSVLTSKNNRLGIEYRGGWRRESAYAAVKKDICAWMKEDRNPDVCFSTMFDLYALPKDFPGYGQAYQEADPYRRVSLLEKALSADINGTLDDTRFVSYIQLHEFEALLLADPEQLKWEFLEHDRPIQRLVDMVSREGGNPELINDNETTAPSKRIIAEIHEYAGSKATSGPLVADKIGMETLCRRCRHFKEWIETLVALGKG
ncbi:MAG: DUF4276 family protein [Desulfotignum sp.]|nr:DUF4276 family protein [Desulfotignum sp.]MCF8138093.1 DUF4276 family protein [Desulfotignum sp.]